MKKEKRSQLRVKATVAKATKRNEKQEAKALRHRMKLIARNAWEKARLDKVIAEKTLNDEEVQDEA